MPTPQPGPHKPTISIAIAMILLGAAVYLATGMESVTALIPSFIGVPILLCGLLAAKARTPALVAALVFNVLGFLGPLGRIIPTAAKGELSIGPAFASQLVFMALAGILAVVLVLAIRRPASQD